MAADVPAASVRAGTRTDSRSQEPPSWRCAGVCGSTTVAGTIPTTRWRGSQSRATSSGSRWRRRQEDLRAAPAGWLNLPLPVPSQVNRSGCATFTVLMFHFTRLDTKVVNDQLRITADVAEEGTGEASGRRGRRGGFSSGRCHGCCVPQASDCPSRRTPASPTRPERCPSWTHTRSTERARP